MPNLGDGLMIRKPGGIEHLWILVTKPDPRNGEVLLVSVTTQRLDSDKTILNVNDHPFVKHPSIVYYADAQITKISAIEAALNNGAIRPRDSVSTQFLARIQDGIGRSAMTPKKIKDAFLKAQSEGRTT